MFEFLIDGIASFIGGYCSQKAKERKITVGKFFFSIFSTLLSVSLFFQLTSHGINFNDLMFGVLLSLSVAFICSVVLIVSFKISDFRRKKK